MNQYIKNSFRLVIGTLIGLIVGLIIALLGTFIFLFFLRGSQGGVFIAVAMMIVVIPRLSTLVIVLFSLISLWRTKRRIEKNLSGPKSTELKKANNLTSLFLMIAIIFSGYLAFKRFDLTPKPRKKVDPESCNKIKDLHYQGLCFQSCITTMKNKDLLAMSNEEREDLAINICGKITKDWMKDNCLGALALKSSDSMICEKIIDTYNRNNCKAHTAKELSDCENLEERFRGICYQSVAKAKKDISICDEKPSYTKDTCYAGVYSAIAVEKKDKTACDKISRAPSRDSCYASVAIASNDRSACNDIIMLIHKNRCIRETSEK